MITCTNCGKRNPNTNKFCGECGADLSEAKMYCIFCGKVHTDGEKYCTDCGEKLVNKIDYENILKREIELEYERKRELEKEMYGKQKIPPKTQNQIYARDNFRCRICGAEENLEIDYIVPPSKGGKGNINNLQTICKDCNMERYR